MLNASYAFNTKMTDSTNDEDAYLEQLAREDDFIIKCMTTYERLREV